MHSTATRTAALCLLLTTSACQGQVERFTPGEEADMQTDMTSAPPDMASGEDLASGGEDADMDAPDVAPDMEPAGFGAERSGVFIRRTRRATPRASAR